MTWAADAIPTFVAVAILLVVLLGGLIVLLAGWPLNDRRRRVVADIGWLALASLGVWFLWWWLGGEPRPTAFGPATPMLLLAIFVVASEISPLRDPEILVGRIAFAAVILLSVAASLTALLSIEVPNLRVAVLNLSTVGVIVIICAMTFAGSRPWTVYSAGLLLAGTSVVIAVLGGGTLSLSIEGLERASFAVLAIEALSVVMLLVGVAMTLYGNLWHAAQWLAAGAGLVATAAGLAGVVGSGDGARAAVVAGVLTLIIAPRLIGRYVTKAHNEG